MSSTQGQPPEPRRSQSTTSLSRFYNGVDGQNTINGNKDEELNDPKMDYCNSFWGQGDRGFEVIMARLRGAGRTVDELKAFWKERAAIEEDYAKRLHKLSKYTLGKDEVGELSDSLQHLLNETAQQGQYHSSLGSEIKQTVEQPTLELSLRLTNLKKGLQTSIEKAYKNKGLQDQHVQKARERYEQDCLKLNSYTAQSSLTQGKELEKLQSKLDRVRQTIGANEQDFRQFVRVLEQTQARWESEWKGFCDHVQDIEEDRLALTKDLTWVYANAVSQVCVEDDSSCERIREKLEQFEPQNDMLNFVKGWGTGDMIPDPPRFINYNLGESYPSQPTFHIAHFQRLSSRPPMPPSMQSQQAAPEPEPERQEQSEDIPEIPESNGHDDKALNGIADNLQRTTLNDEPPSSARSTPALDTQKKTPFGGIALPGMANATSPPPQEESSKFSSMPPPPTPPAMTMPEPRIPSRQSNHSPAPRNITNEEDPMAKALADLRREPPPPGSVRRNASHRRAESVVSASGSTRGSQYGHGIKSPTSPAPNRMSYQQGMPPAQSRGSVDMTLSPPQPGHTAAALARSMEDFRQQSSRGPESKRQSVNYSNFADDIVGAHPTSRPSSPAAAQRAPSPAMMQPPTQPATHIADEVLSQYHQAFPGERQERSRSRAGSVISSHSRAGSFVEQQQQHQPPPSPGREAFAGIGAGGGRSPSPQPHAFRSPSPSPNISQGALGPQNLGISLDAKGGVAQDTMAEAYRRQFEQQQQQQQQQQRGGPPPQQLSNYPGQRNSQYGSASPSISQQSHQQQQQQFGGQQSGFNGQDQRGSMYGAPKSPNGQPPNIAGNRPTSGYGQASQSQGYGNGPSQQQAYGQAQQQQPPPPQPAYNAHPSQQPQTQTQQYHGQQGFGGPPPSQQPPQPAYGQHPSPNPQSQYSMSNGYPNQQQQYNAGGNGPSGGYQSSPSVNNQYNRSASPAPIQQQQQNQYARSVSPAPMQQSQQQQQYGYNRGGPSPQPQYNPNAGRAGQSPSPQPNQPPNNAAPTGQWSTTGLPVLFYVKALYDYGAQSAVEFDFQAGDIIAVTSTPDDGWWSGELLDEARRIPGRTDFPSNL
ncbi:uncharacterized protein L201_000111 [Kwoniella dendrophila CBS 6074]|uniref:Septation protein imp2 n=1 Tax=Kwoniella dendrophila CBS 6074 TaxID=1295534 RepID=A0AAX4JK32_9TREE